jgi:ubiquinone/menaquinone biosynthesis C-methylase UbiE
MTALTPEQIKACCAAAYGSDLAALLLGDSYHPGGLALTRRLARQLDLPPDAHVLDVAAGRGATARVLASEFGLRVSGVDLSAANVALASGTAASDGLTDRVSFQIADAERLPHPDAGFDAVVVECALCTFPDKPAAVSEIARELRKGGKLGLTDVLAETDRLSAELTTLAARVACIADALPMHAYAALVDAAGLSVTRIERHDTTIMRMIDQIEARLTLVRLTAPAQVAALGLDIDRTRATLTAARAAVADGILGYGLLVAQKP